MIREAVQRGLRVGVTAVSHKVIRNLLEATLQAAKEMNLGINCAHKVSDKSREAGPIEELVDNGAFIERISSGAAHVAGGTAWFWARPEAHEAVDILFVDEAGQMSLAYVLAASTGAKTTVLLGDPQQLEQPQQASHPDGTDVSALEYLLDGRETIEEHRGIFMPETHRLAPSICKFTSELFYDGRLRSRAGLEQQRLEGTERFDGAGLWMVQVTHRGNQNSSTEEADVAAEIVSILLRDGAQWIDNNTTPHRLRPEDILVVAPYNAQVAKLADKLQPRGIRVGTVDKFQGQEAPVVIYSMATSTPEDAPRGMEFLYSLNRLNVATSRARCACILIASPRLLEPECKSPRQMQLANALCRYAEMATIANL
jgi:superfamily I DNA and/or RNA helicase